MKRIIFIAMLIASVGLVAFAGYSTLVYTEQGGSKMVVASGGEIEVQSGGTLDVQGTMTLSGTGTITGAPTFDHILGTQQAAGYDGHTTTKLYYSDPNTCWEYWNGSAVVQLTSGTGDNTLDNAYDQGGAGAGKKINVDTGAVELEVADTKDNPALHLDCDNTTNDPTAFLIENAADAANAITIDIDAQSTGRDIEGTGATWHVTGAGVLTVADIQATTGTITTGTVTTLTSTTGTISNLTVSSAMVNSADLTLDDGSGASPTLTLTDATDEEMAFQKLDNGDSTVTIPADTDFEITTGNLAVGNGSPGTAAMDGEDFYVEGDSEFDGSVQMDGVLTSSSSAVIPTMQVTTLLDVDEEIDIDFDNADEEVSIVNSAEYGADGAQVTIENTDADVGAAMYLLRLRYTDDGQANADFAVFEDNNGDDMITFTDGGAITAAGTVQGATVKATTLLDVDEEVDIDLDSNDEELDLTTSATDYAADSAVATIYASGAGATNNTYLLRLRHAADGDAQDHFLVCEDNDGDDMFKVDSGGAVTMAGTATFSGGQTKMVMFQPKEAELDGTNPPTLSDHGTDGQCNISALQFDADGGATGDDICYISWKVPDGYVVDSARLNVCYTFSTAEDAADEAQFDFAVNAVAAGETLDAAGTALADQSTVISDASADNGKLHITQYNIEVEDIAVDDLVTIEIAVDESASALSASSTLDVLYFEIEYESTE